ncbi:MAG: hypothetical protein V2A64_00410 [Candidatus Omnitrophota bacterium]
MKIDFLIYIFFIFGLLHLLFCNTIGGWNAAFRKWLAKKFPFWAKMAGLPEDKLQYYLSNEFGRKQAILTGTIFILLGVIFTLIGIFNK